MANTKAIELTLAIGPPTIGVAGIVSGSKARYDANISDTRMETGIDIQKSPFGVPLT